MLGLRAGCIEGLMREGAVPAAEAFAEIEKCYERVVNDYTGCGSYRDALRNVGLLTFRGKDWGKGFCAGGSVERSREPRYTRGQEHKNGKGVLSCGIPVLSG